MVPAGVEGTRPQALPQDIFMTIGGVQKLH